MEETRWRMSAAAWSKLAGPARGRDSLNYSGRSETIRPKTVAVEKP